MIGTGSRQKKNIGLPAGRIIYSDTQEWKALEQALYDPELGLAGRPDYLAEQDDQIIPVEVKSSRVSAAPYDGHIYQLASYCLLVARCLGKRPDYGILHYPGRTFAIDFTAELESALLDMLEEIRQQERRRDVRRSHQSPARCKACGFAELCTQSLSGR